MEIVFLGSLLVDTDEFMVNHGSKLDYCIVDKWVSMVQDTPLNTGWKGSDPEIE